MKTQETIDRITQLQEDDMLSGVIDDRGKFIYIPRAELEAVAKFIKQRGRVSISELAESSNKLINLTPDAAATTMAWNLPFYMFTNDPFRVNNYTFNLWFILFPRAHNIISYAKNAASSEKILLTIKENISTQVLFFLFMILFAITVFSLYGHTIIQIAMNTQYL